MFTGRSFGGNGDGGFTGYRMIDSKLVGLFVWKDVVRLGYPCLESVLSVEPMLDEMLFSIDQTSDDKTISLVDALSLKFPHKTRVISFKWPESSKGGEAIGIASNFALSQVQEGHYCCNVQADELWPTELMIWTRDNWRECLKDDISLLRYKVLNLEHNMQFFQGGVEWDGRKDTPEWGWQSGAGYNVSVKIAKRCPEVDFAPDGWSFQGKGKLAHCIPSNMTPILHAHDNFRDHYIAMRRNAADNFWTGDDFKHYAFSADMVEQTRNQWFDDPKWTATTSPFDSLLPDFVKPLIGKTRYEVRYDVLEEWNG